MTIEAPVLLTVRGTHRPASLEAARELHNQTAGSPAGIAAARELGDLSHKVYAPAAAGKHSVAKTGELLFMDQWVNAEGIGKFFSNAHVATQGENMFTSKEPTVWMRAVGAFTYQLEAPASRAGRYVGMLRAPVKSIEATIKAFGEMARGGLTIGRRRGQISHNLYVKMGPPGETPEVLGVDLWHDLAGLQEHYADATVMGANLGFAGAPTPTVWEQAAGEWSEW
jgi:hypothetical protein